MDRRTRIFLLGGLIVTMLVAAVVSGFASGDPDGLERVAIDKEFEGTATDHALDGSPLADYAVEGIDDERVSTGISGIIGVAVTLTVTVGLLYGVRFLHRRRTAGG
jgi:hypothetical protein